jgi:hypothetical protein
MGLSGEDYIESLVFHWFFLGAFLCTEFAVSNCLENLTNTPKEV